MAVIEARSVLGPDGSAEKVPSELTPERLLELYRLMVTLRAFDTRSLNLNRQGRIHFFAPATGQEAAIVGSAYALDREDWVFPTYREGGVLLVRGVPLRTLYDQIFGNATDLTKGRQMPNHWASREHRVVSISSPVGTQIAQAPGFAYAQKLKKERAATVCYLGDGATSEGDFHAGMNFAGVLKVPCVFFCQNNQWAITVPCARQMACESIAAKAAAYGFEGVRVDGNDVLAVYRTVRQALEKARSGGGPTLIEALTYRIGPHSTSDDPRRYRPESDVEPWRAKDPITRFERFLRKLGHLDEKGVKRTIDAASDAVREAAEAAEKAGPPPVASIFDDVYAQPTPLLREQRAELEDLIEKGVVAPKHGPEEAK
jgi:2-oxoisovalerate dehydrogenase E1 component alpha subunit